MNSEYDGRVSQVITAFYKIAASLEGESKNLFEHF